MLSADSIVLLLFYYSSVVSLHDFWVKSSLYFSYTRPCSPSGHPPLKTSFLSLFFKPVFQKVWKAEPELCAWDDQIRDICYHSHHTDSSIINCPKHLSLSVSNSVTLHTREHKYNRSPKKIGFLISHLQASERSPTMQISPLCVNLYAATVISLCLVSL